MPHILPHSCRPTRTLLFLLLGVLLGVSTTWSVWWSYSGRGELSLPSPCVSPLSIHPPLLRPAESGFMLVGIMTAAKYVDTRAYNVWKTWAADIPGRVLFFVAEDTVSEHADMPLVRLKGVDDTYPPQKKSFAMIKWMADNMLDKYSWFVRADDDLYIKGEAMEKFLRRLDPSRPYSIGQAGLGNTAEYGLLALGASDNYCMGGPGVVLSRETLRQVSPHLQECLSHLLTGHEDVELGRCIRRNVGISCTWNYEMQKLFHNNQSATSAYTGGLDETKNAITLHPIKEPAVMRRMHAHMKVSRLRRVREDMHSLTRTLSTQQPPSLIRTLPNSLSALPYFDFIDNAKIIFCAHGVMCPRHTVEQRTRNEMAHIVTQLFDEFNVKARQRGRMLQFQGLQYAYQRVSPRYGVDYVLDILLWFKKFRPPHRTTLSVRRHAYVQQSFAPLQAISEADLMKELQLSAHHPSSTINLILPLKGRAAIFTRFVTHLRNVCMRAHALNLVVVLYSSDDEAENRATIDQVQEWMKVKVVEMGEEPFSRGVALTRGSDHLPPDALLFFTDVDMLFTCDTLNRIRHNTIYRSQVFFPIVFSEFSPDSWSENERLLADAFHYGRRRGYFRHFGYGLCSIYKGDLETAGGFNTSIAGWGMEDVDLFEKTIKSQSLRVLRAPEPGLVHIYHPIHCDPLMPPQQRKMCEGSKAASLASIDSLLQTLHHLT